MLASHVTGYSRASLFAFPERRLDEGQLERLDRLLARRCQGEPIAYLTGVREFWSLPLAVSTGSLIPRPDTELLVEQALQLQASLPAGCIIDLGTGSGAIALAVAQEISDRPVIAVERHADALQVARDNISRFGHGRVHLIQSDWLDAIESNTAALIIANPPYLAENDPHLPHLRHEPRTALVSGQSGLEDIEHIIDDARRVGLPGCPLLLEHGNEQGASVRSLLRHYNYTQVSTCHDLAGHERMSHGRLPAEP